MCRVVHVFETTGSNASLETFQNSVPLLMFSLVQCSFFVAGLIPSALSLSLSLSHTHTHTHTHLTTLIVGYTRIERATVCSKSVIGSRAI